MFQLLRSNPRLFLDYRARQDHFSILLCFHFWREDSTLHIWTFLDPRAQSFLCRVNLQAYIGFYDVIQEMSLPAVSSDDEPGPH